MKKLFGIFVAGAAALSLASCEEDNEEINSGGDIVIPGDTVVTEEDLPGLFATAFSGGSIIGEDGIGSGTYSFDVESRIDYHDSYYGYYEGSSEFAISTKFGMGNTGPIIDFSLMHDFVDAVYASSSQKTEYNFITNFVDFYLKATAEDSDSNKVSIIDDLFNGFGDVLVGEASDYDYAKVSLDNVMTLVPYLLGDIEIVDGTGGDMSGILDILSTFEHTVADFMLPDFTEYRLVSQNEAYATINFEPFNEVAYELVYDTFNFISLAFEGMELDEEFFLEKWTTAAGDYADLVVSFELGINPTAGNITKISFDTTSIFQAIVPETEMYFRFEYLYTETATALSVPTERVVDANPIIPVIIEQLELEAAYEMFADDIYSFFEMNGFYVDEFFVDEEYAGVSYEDGFATGLEDFGYYYDDELGWGYYVDALNEELLSSLAEQGMTIQSFIELYGEDVYIPESMSLLDLEKAFITTDGEGKYFLTLYWADGTEVFTAPVTIDAYSFYYEILISIDSDNFKTFAE